MMKLLWSLLVLAALMCIASAMALTEEEFMQQQEPEADTLLDETDKRGFHNFMDPLSAGFANKRGFSNFMDPLSSGFGTYQSKKGFNNFMDPLTSGFGARGKPYKRGFNAFMDPLKSGFGSYKRFQHFMDPLASGFHVKRDDE